VARAQTLLDTFKKNCQAPATLKVAIGAQVMLTRNLDFDLQLVNGARGTVVGFATKKGSSIEYPEVLFQNGVRQVITPTCHSIEEEGKLMVEYFPVPLKLAWALTMHKAQGMTLDCITVSLDKKVKGQMGYSVLSRVRTPEGLFLLEFYPDDVFSGEKEVLHYYQELEKSLNMLSTDDLDSLPIRSKKRKTSHDRDSRVKSRKQLEE
jgi:ATP-dependent DNA helicase PIF1